MSDNTLAKEATYPARFLDKLTMGMPLSEYARKLVTPFNVVAAILLFVMSAIAFINVLSRYLFHFSFAATEELTINLFVWLTVVGSGIAFERGGQLGMVTLFNLFPRKLRKLVILLSSILSASLFGLVNLFLPRERG